ncbi:MAG: prolyl oligopeptidase family serine peptidase [Candidatus Saccharicenans sp.]|nr:prolyl oligopeptidase family serine peptidase [Candidatus Saccharicenans sp.]MDH7492989.1 prolyl oligopeptidase family serine peptidase [Candidatus Saccharicenans sp.]
MRKAKMMTMLAFIFVLLIIIVVAACRKTEEKITYPLTKKVDQVDDYFGTKVPDPYRWLEDDNSEETRKWVEEQNRVTFAYLEKIPYREKIRQRLKDIYNYPRMGQPVRAGEYYFFYKNDGLQNQSVIYIQKGLEGQPEVFIDPNQLSPDGTVRIGLAGFSPDFRYVAINRSEAGSDWSEIRVMEIATKKELPDRIQWVKFSGAAWYRDGFFYSGYDKPAPGQELRARNEFQKVFYHKLGEPQEKDVLIYQDPKNPLRYFNLGVTEDQKYAILEISAGTSGNELYWKGLSAKKSDFELLVPGFDNDSEVIDNLGDRFLVRTNIGAPNFRLVLIDPKKPGRENWQEVLPEKPEVLTAASTAGGYLFAAYLQDARTRVYQYRTDGQLLKEIELPAIGTASGFGGWRDDKVIFYTFQSFNYPPTIYKYDLASGQSEVFVRQEVKFNPEDFEVNQVFYNSKDGTRVPMFIVHKRGLALDGQNPTYLTAYGGFNISLTPAFNPALVVILENGGVFAQPNLRGGGEYGEKWHRAGMLENKQNVFDDFIAAAEYLIQEKYTSPRYLAISGASNGGLLVGAVMTQRPELFGVAFPAVGVMDMLRFHKFTVGWGWVVEYGSSDQEEQFRYLYKYSPLHNLRDGVCYPATMVTTADHDDRVVPAHSFKFAATLQEKQACSRPVLIRIETRSGHGSSNVTKAIDELTDKYAFMFYVMGLKPIYR